MQRESPAIAGLMVLFAVVWAQSQGILALVLHTRDWPRNLVFFLRVLLKCSCIMYCSSSLFAVGFVSLLLFSAASALSCLAHHSLGEALHSCFGRVGAAVYWTPDSQGWWILLYLYSHEVGACFMLRVSKKPIIHNPENQQTNQAVAMNGVGGRDKQPSLQHLKMSCFFWTAVFLVTVEVTVL